VPGMSRREPEELQGCQTGLHQLSHAEDRIARSAPAVYRPPDSHRAGRGALSGIDARDRSAVDIECSGALHAAAPRLH
jgi:hypothetical protein